MRSFQPALKSLSAKSSAMLPIFTLIIALLASGCGGSSGSSSGSGGSTPPSTANEWTWMSGSNVGNAMGVYGTLGVAAASNVPGNRMNAVSWIDSSGNLWLFGGVGSSSPTNDLWEFNPSTKQWTWMSGSNGVGSQGFYGTQGVAFAGNAPGARDSSVGWTDSSGNLWLFGGVGYDSNGAEGFLNDLWMFNPTAKIWTWVSGSRAANTLGVYGTQGVASTSNVPGSRIQAVSWIDKSGNFWLFGGSGIGSPLAVGLLNDLWMFNPTAKIWTWVSGSSAVNTLGVYGTMGTPTASNAPGARDSSVGWTDSSGNLWLFGGYGNDSTSTQGDLNDLWEFSPTTKEWTWVSGSNTVGSGPAVYGTKGVAAASNTPGARGSSVSWIDGSGNLWLFGGIPGFLGIYSFESNLNDLWEFSPTNKEWTWVSGANTIPAGSYGQSGVYGTQGVAAASNVPGARDSAVSWVDSSGNLWLFGGLGYDSTGALVDLNDLWRYQP